MTEATRKMSRIWMGMLMLLAGYTVAGQEKITSGIAITYRMASAVDLPDDAAHFTQFVDILSPPFFIQLLGTMHDHQGYMVTHTYTHQTLYCHADKSGISFVPEWISIHSCNCYKSQPTGRKDMILGLPTQEYHMVLERDTLKYWSTDAFHMNDPRQNGLKGILLKYEMAGPHGDYVFEATSIDTINLKHERYDPSLHFSPLTFDTKEEAFDYCRLHSGTSQVFPDTLGSSEIFLVLPTIRQRSSAIAREINPYKQGEAIPPVDGISVNPDLPVIWEDFNNQPLLMLAIDFEMMDPIPSYILEWIAEVQTNFPDIKLAVVSRSPKKQIIKALKQYWELYTIPHFAVKDDYYQQFNWRDPLSYIMLNRDHTLAFLKSGYDVHSKEELNRALSQLR